MPSVLPGTRVTRAVVSLAMVAAVALAGHEAWARQRRMGTSNRFPIPTESSFDGGFNFCRVAFQTGRFRRGVSTGGVPWGTS